MIKVSVLYPYEPDAAFDMDYYLSRHIPMVRERLGTACKGVAVERGLSGAAPDSPPNFTTICHLLFDTLETFQSSFGPHAAEITADVPNYAAIPPVMQISEVKVSE